MERRIVQTEDGSSSLYVPELDEQYHSRHGAIQESRHVFIQMGLLPLVAARQEIDILEIGFGTGLNALLTALSARELGLRIRYWTVEAYPMQPEEILALNYPEMIAGEDVMATWQALHRVEWGSLQAITPAFQLCKMQARIEDFQPSEMLDLIYFDAFAPEKQPELWTEAVFARMATALKPGGALVTYCAKGAVRRNLQAQGLQVDRLPGPPGKREMLRGRRPI